MKVLITGGSGFVGSAIVRKLIRRGHDIRVLVRPSSPLDNLEGLDVELVYGDLTESQSVQEAMAGCEAVVHAAADYRIWVPRADEMFQANVAGTQNVLNGALSVGVRRLVYTSSVATIGLPKGEYAANEDTPIEATDLIGPYKTSKYFADKLVTELAGRSDMEIVIVHPSTPIGPRDIRPTPTGKIVIQAASGRMPAFVDTGLNVVHVDDVAEGHALALERGIPGRRYILGGENMTLAEILRVIADIVHQRAPKLRIPHGAIMPIAALAEAWGRLTGKEPFVTRDGVRLARKRMFYSSERAIRELGYRHRPPQEALGDAIDWFKQHGYVA
jgi:dihydroflavonol-4-reductase